MADLDFEIDFFADEGGCIFVRAQCPFGAGQGRFSLANLAWPEAPPVAQDGGASSEDLRALGASLFTELFHDRTLPLFFQCVGSLKANQQLRLRIRLALDDPDLMRIHQLPWELLFSSFDNKFLALDRRFSIVRHLEVPQPERPIHYRPPLRILCVASQPTGYEALKIHEELAWIEKAWARPWRRRVEVHVLRHASLAELRAELVAREPHLLHFLGHGEYDPETGEGLLLFEDDLGGPVRVTGEALADQVVDQKGLRGVFLNACWTAKAGHGNPFSGVATALVRAGVPAVLGMQFEISDAAARVFSRTVYQRLALGDSVDAAVVDGRLAVRRDIPRTFEWATPALFLRTLEVRPPRRRNRPLWFVLGAATALLIGWLFTWGPLSCPAPNITREGVPTRVVDPSPKSGTGGGRAPNAPVPLFQRTEKPKPVPKIDHPLQLRDSQTAQLAEFGSRLRAHFRHPAKTLEFSLISSADSILTKTVSAEGKVEFITHLGSVLHIEVLEIDWRKREVRLLWRRK